MSRDWKRLSRAIKDARVRLHLTQKALADAAGVSEGTVQNLEAGETRHRLPPSLPKVEAALGWEHGSAHSVLAGGEPTLTPARTEAAPVSEGSSAMGDLPLRIVQELTDGPLLDTAVLDLSQLGSDARMVVVVKGKDGASPDQIRRDLLAWARAQERLQGLKDDDEPPLANGA